MAASVIILTPFVAFEFIGVTASVNILTPSVAFELYRRCHAYVNTLIPSLARGLYLRNSGYIDVGAFLKTVTQSLPYGVISR